MRHVYPTREIPHLWAHQTQGDARNSQGNLYFKGPTIYSYRDSWPLAHIYTNGERRLVLVNDDRYSNTTAKHTSMVRSACGHIGRAMVPGGSLRVDDPYRTERYHRENLRHILGKMQDKLDKARRALRPENVEWCQRVALALHEQATVYCDFFGLPAPAAFPADAWQAAIDRVQRIANPDPVRDKAKFKARERRKAILRAELAAQHQVYCNRVAAYNAEYLACMGDVSPDDYWREHGTLPHVGNMTARYPSMPWKLEPRMRQAGLELPEIASARSTRRVLLRVHNDEIHTSMGARVPLNVAPLLWGLVQRARANGGYTPSENARVQIGHYALNRIDADGTMRAGCHTILYDELAIMARKLGLEVAS